MDKTELLLKELTEANGVSGFESEVRTIMARELKPLSDRIEYDKLGSIMGVKKGASESPKVLVAGHMDEIGFVVREITSDGYLKFLPLGGWWGHVALGQRMRVITSNGPVVGVIGSQPPHLLQAKDREKVIEVKEMFLDIGALEKFDVKKKYGVKVGDPIIPDSPFTIMSNPKMYMAKAFDNRSACAVVVDTLRALKNARHPNTVQGAASVQEEVGLRGATTLAHLADPDVAIIVDTGIATDMPPGGFKNAERFGAGPAILIMDGSMIPNIKLRDLAVETAKQKKIPFHLTAMDRGGTDGGRVHISRFGVPSLVIGPPVRYIHSHNAIMYRPDYDNTVKLVVELIKKLDKKTVTSLTR